MENKFTTIQVSVKNSDEIKEYCTRHGKGKGAFVDAAWQYLKPFVESDNLDIFTDTPYIPIHEQPSSQDLPAAKVDQSALVEALRSIAESMQPAKLIDQGITLGSLQEKCATLEQKALSMEIASQDNAKRVDDLLKIVNDAHDQEKQLKAEIEKLEKYKRAAQAEFKRIKENQSYFGKLNIFEP